jgi:hypothetical protein
MLKNVRNASLKIIRKMAHDRVVAIIIGFLLLLFAVLKILLDIELHANIMVLFACCSVVWLLYVISIKRIYVFMVRRGWYTYVYLNNNLMNATKYAHPFSYFYLIREKGQYVDNGTMLQFQYRLYIALLKQNKSVAHEFDEHSEQITRSKELSNILKVEKLFDLYNNYCHEYIPSTSKQNQLKKQHSKRKRQQH